jgi:hypothetical protein
MKMANADIGVPRAAKIMNENEKSVMKMKSEYQWRKAIMAISESGWRRKPGEMNGWHGANESVISK